MPHRFSLPHRQWPLIHGVGDSSGASSWREAGSVYVRDLGTQFFASVADEEEFGVTTTTVSLEPAIELVGTAQEVAGAGVQLATTAGTLDVNTDAMPYDPLDDEGFQKLTPGDRVRVTGYLGEDLFADRDLMATRIVTLQPASI